MARLTFFLLALLAGAAAVSADFVMVQDSPEIWVNSSGPSGLSTTTGTSCLLCDKAGNCYPHAFAKDTTELTCQGPCGPTCTSTCSFGQAGNIPTNQGLLLLVGCGCKVAGDTGACGDPHFVGNNGVEYDFHGVADKEYAIISDADFALTAHMIGQDETATGYTGTWMSRLGFMYNFGGATQKLTLALAETNDRSTTLDVVVATFNGQTVDLSTGPLIASGLTLKLENGAFHVMIDGHIDARVTIGDHKFPNGFHLDFTIKALHVTPTVHGVLGQTFQVSRTESLKAFAEAAAAAAGTAKPYADSDIVEGADADSQISGLFETDFKYNRFAAPGAVVSSIRKLLTAEVQTAEVPFVANWAGNSMRILV